MTRLDLICECSHRRSAHVCGDDGKACKRSCGCGKFRRAVRPEAAQDAKSAATGDEAA